MVVPDIEQICEIMLFSEGFGSARVLAKKMTVLYKLARELLSKQFHYDFGLRAIKSVLSRAGSLKQNEPHVSEQELLMRALRDTNLPKLVFRDVSLFLALLSDVFPGLEVASSRYQELNDAIEADLKERGYEVLSEQEQQVDKIMQLYETLMTRHATMVVGPTCGGKTVIIETLARAQTRLELPTKLHVLNPKAQDVNELYGKLDADTRDWSDGLLSHTFREVNKPLPEGQNERHYIVFDGDVDAVWVENMNSVMDDNKLLTLPNGERIRLQDHCKLLFEVFDLQYASPATISRCGMVYVDSKNLGYNPYGAIPFFVSIILDLLDMLCILLETCCIRSVALVQRSAHSGRQHAAQALRKVCAVARCVRTGGQQWKGVHNAAAHHHPPHWPQPCRTAVQPARLAACKRNWRRSERANTRCHIDGGTLHLRVCLVYRWSNCSDSRLTRA
jgi:hypothetical protein